jgi:hypothetical protein
MKLKFKSTGKKVQEHNVGAIKMFSHSEATHILDNVIEQPVNKDKKVKTPAKKVVYISKNGSKAIFDSIHLCAKIFNVDVSTIKYKIEHPIPKRKATLKGGDWLKGARLEYLNN